MFQVGGVDLTPLLNGAGAFTVLLAVLYMLVRGVLVTGAAHRDQIGQLQRQHDDIRTEALERERRLQRQLEVAYRLLRASTSTAHQALDLAERAGGAAVGD